MMPTMGTTTDHSGDTSGGKSSSIASSSSSSCGDDGSNSYPKARRITKSSNTSTRSYYAVRGARGRKKNRSNYFLKEPAIFFNCEDMMKCFLLVKEKLRQEFEEEDDGEIESLELDCQDFDNIYGALQYINSIQKDQGDDDDQSPSTENQSEEEEEEVRKEEEEEKQRAYNQVLEVEQQEPSSSSHATLLGGEKEAKEKDCHQEEDDCEKGRDKEMDRSDQGQDTTTIMRTSAASSLFEQESEGKEEEKGVASQEEKGGGSDDQQQKDATEIGDTAAAASSLALLSCNDEEQNEEKYKQKEHQQQQQQCQQKEQAMNNNSNNTWMGGPRMTHAMIMQQHHYQQTAMMRNNGRGGYFPAPTQPTPYYPNQYIPMTSKPPPVPQPYRPYQQHTPLPSSHQMPTNNRRILDNKDFLLIYTDEEIFGHREYKRNKPLQIQWDMSAQQYTADYVKGGQKTRHHTQFMKVIATSCQLNVSKFKWRMISFLNADPKARDVMIEIMKSTDKSKTMKTQLKANLRDERAIQYVRNVQEFIKSLSPTCDRKGGTRPKLHQRSIQTTILALISGNHDITAGQVAKDLGVSEGMVKNVFQMKNDQVLERKRKTRKDKMPPEEEPPNKKPKKRGPGRPRKSPINDEPNVSYTPYTATATSTTATTTAPTAEDADGMCWL